LRCVIALVLLLEAGAAGAAEVQEQRSPQTGLSSWRVVDRGFSLELIQVSPDYVKAFYASRGLPPKLIDGIAGYCVFGTVARNESDEPLSYRAADWRYVTADGARHPLKTKSDWVKEWKDMGVAYTWSLLPDDQTLDPGDWNQGFTTLALAPGTAFHLSYAWSQHDQTYTGKLEGLRCAPAEPQTP
jgi:hypothetical protein